MATPISGFKENYENIYLLPYSMVMIMDSMVMIVRIDHVACFSVRTCKLFPDENYQVELEGYMRFKLKRLFFHNWLIMKHQASFVGRMSYVIDYSRLS